MLPANLLIARRRGKRIEPVWLTPNSDTFLLVKQVEQSFLESVGTKKKIVDERIQEIENTSHFDYRHIRGLATLLERRCSFIQGSTVEPPKARELVFHEAANKLPITSEERLIILKKVASHLNVTIPELETSLYADLKDESILSSFEPIGHQNLIKRYNLALAQTLLFNCTVLSFRGELNWKIVFGLVKWLGLMYDIEESKDNDYLVTVDGPYSFLRASRRYGTRLAMLLPHIVNARKWEVHVTIIERRDGVDCREYQFTLDSHNHGTLFMAEDHAPEESYDSNVEEQFAKDFRTANTMWTISREPRPLKSGHKIFLPDFVFELAGTKVYMEIVGFWTDEYLSRKISKLRNLEDIELVVAVDKSNACEELDTLSDNIHVFYYRRKVPVIPIIRYLSRKEKELANIHLQRLRNLDIHLEQNVVRFSELAAELGVIENALREHLRRNTPEDYCFLSELLVDKRVINEIDKALKARLKRGPFSLSKATEIVEASGIDLPIIVLEFLGYDINWESLDSDKIQVFGPPSD